MSKLTQSSRRWLGAATGLALLAGAVTADRVAGADDNEFHTSAEVSNLNSTFVPITPCRLMDTRGGIGVGGRTSELSPNETHVQVITGDTATGDCNIEQEVNAVSLNVTALNGTERSFLTISPAGEPTPTVSNLNWEPGAPPTPNKVDVGLSSDGRFAVTNAFGTVDVIIDVTGYFTSDVVGGLVDSLDRLADSQPSVLSTERSAATVDGTVSAPLELVSLELPRVDGVAMISYDLSHAGVNTLAGVTLVCELIATPGGVLSERRTTVTRFETTHAGDNATIGLATNAAVEITLSCRPGLAAPDGGGIAISDLKLSATVVPTAIGFVPASRDV